ncbi:MAG TPA: transcription termination factor Rho [Ktedonobacterales bacterium]
MPEDQETLTPTRRRTRRTEAAAASDSTTATTPASAPAAEAAEPSPPKRRRSTRAAAEQPSLSGEMSGEAPPAAASPKSRRTRATAAAGEADGATEDAPTRKRASRSRAAKQAPEITEAAQAAQGSVSEAVVPVTTPAGAHMPAEPAALATSVEANMSGDGEATPARRSRVPRVRHAHGESPEASQDVVPTPTTATPPTPEAAPAPVAEQPQQRRGFTVWVNQEQRPGERSGDVSGGAPRQPQRSHQNPAQRGGQGQGSMPPYRPGNRGASQQRPQPPGREQHYPGGEGQPHPSQPHTPYQPYAPYGQPGQQGQQGQQGQYGGGNGNRSQEQHRPARGGRQYGYPPYGDQQGGRGYPDQRDQRDMRSPRDRRPPASPASYAEQAERGGPLSSRRGPGGVGRRGMDTRGGRPGREAGSIYTHAPAGSEGRYGYGQRQPPPATPARTVEVSGLLWLGGGQGMSPAEILDARNLTPHARVNPEDVRRYGLRSGDMVSGVAEERGGRRYMVRIEQVNDAEPESQRDRPLFEQLTATFPERRIRLEQGAHPPISTRLIDLFAPLGFGSRALVVAPPKTGKTTLIREAAEAVLTGYSNAVVMAVLVGERPEEVTDLRARLEPRGGLVYAASFDEETERHAWLVQVAVERAKRVAESGRDAFMVLDSLTRLARAENLASRGAGRTLSGGIDAQALDTGRRAFGAARNLDEGGSLTILATCLVDTGSRQDDVVYEEFKGTGNMELHLSRELAQRRLFPAVDVIKSSTRREEMLLTPEELRATTALRRRLADVPPAQATQQLLNVLERTPSNAALLQALEQSGWLTSGSR